MREHHILPTGHMTILLKTPSHKPSSAHIAWPGASSTWGQISEIITMELKGKKING
jgi:hypothetical protein